MVARVIAGLDYLTDNQDDAEAQVNLWLVLAAVTMNQWNVIDEVASVPGSPSNGDAYILTAADVGGAADDIVWYYQGWRVVTPREGTRAYNQFSDTQRIFNGTNWVNA